MFYLWLRSWDDSGILGLSAILWRCSPAFTTTKVPWFGGTSSWEQYQQVFDAIVLSNGWDDATAALQLLGSYGMLSPCDSDSDPDQPVADGPMDPYVARGPVGSYGMLSPCDSDSDPDQPVADGPVGPYVARGPLGSYGMLSLCSSDSDPDQPAADGPVGPYVTRPYVILRFCLC